MTLRLLSILPVSLALSCLVLSAPARADIVWETNYDQARAKSIASGKPLFVDVYTTWCGWCKKLDSTVYPDARVQQLSKSFVMVRLNAEAEGAPFAKVMNVHAFPALFFATARGQQVSRLDGYIDLGYFLDEMQQTLLANGPIRPRRAVKAPRTARIPARPTARRVSRPRPQSVAAVARTWKRAPELSRTLKRPGYGGAFVLGDGGVVAVESPSRNKRK